MTLFLVPMLFPTCSREQGLYVVPLFPTPIGGNLGNRVTPTPHKKAIRTGRKKPSLGLLLSFRDYASVRFR